MRTLPTLVLLLTLLTACLPAGRPPDLEEAARLRLASTDCRHREEFLCAEQELARVPAVDPAFVPSEVLLLADYRVILGEHRRAAATLEAGLDEITENDPARPELLLRLALLHLDQQNEKEALRWGGKLPADDPRAGIFQATLELRRGEEHAALRRLNDLLTLPLDKDLASRVYFTAARAYTSLGLEAEASLSLFHAINFAQSPALTQAIKRLWAAQGGS